MDYTCRWCKEIKPEEAFVRRDPKQPYSDRNIRCCKACNTAKNRERYKAPEVKEKQLEANAKWRDANPEKMEEYKRLFNIRNPANRQAKDTVKRMLRDGHWSKQPCEICGGSIQVEAHHDSYAKPHWKTVRWLCKAHHEQWHQVLDPIKKQITEGPLAEAAAMVEKHDAIQEQMSALRKEAAALRDAAESLHFDTWSQVQKAAEPLYRDTFKIK